jgi:hypothetical protein
MRRNEMTVKELRAVLSEMPEDAMVKIDEDGYLDVIGCYTPSEVFDGDPEDAPPANIVLLELR